MEKILGLKPIVRCYIIVFKPTLLLYTIKYVQPWKKNRSVWKKNMKKDKIKNNEQMTIEK